MKKTTKQKLLISTCVLLAAFLLLLILGYATYRKENKKAYADAMSTETTEQNIYGNLLEPTKEQLGYIDPSGIIIQNGKDWVYSKLVDVHYIFIGQYSGQLYVVSDKDVGNIGIACYDKDLRFLTSFDLGGQSANNFFSFSVPDDTYYIRVWSNNQYANILLDWYQNQDPISYYPYNAVWHKGLQSGLEFADPNTTINSNQYDYGYSQGLVDGKIQALRETSTESVTNLFTLTPLFSTIASILSIQIYPKITLAMLLGIPLLLTLGLFVLKLVRG